MATCAGKRSIIGEHHNGRETDGACASRAIREELPGLAQVFDSLTPFPLRARPRWFLFDYPPVSGGAPRYDRCLISEYVLHLPSNASASLAAIRAGRQSESEHEASEITFEPLVRVVRQLHRQRSSFCAHELLPDALFDTIGDLLRHPSLTSTLRTTATALEQAASRVRADGQWRRTTTTGKAMPENYDLSRLVRG
eukprot:CAMPEP_0115832720 /NCGR_PEP_ID=MMETSP0287-20121206/2804_1 /TAXON_ID=412157 /ORGANISM="Chrysochromulina rotalis, Strain UIO044" /LENGTH=195 /DNA_ID=CAMNT_0003286115 /DNA_START=137 /DNA_END=724 /DNA_ORIENTATION=+